MKVESLIGWMTDSIGKVRRDGVAGVKEAAYPAYKKSLKPLSRITPTLNVFERDWSLLIILDACRVDLMQQVESEYEFIQEVDVVDSVGTMTPEWMQNTFVDKFAEEIARTRYVCGNPFSETELNGGDFAELIEAWRYAWDTRAGTLHPRPVTDRAIKTHRDHEPERLIVHYMQPHWPFVPALGLSEGKGMTTESFGEAHEHNVWDRLRAREVEHEEVWAGYRANLEYALDEVSVLLNNVDADGAVISSDHGNAMGEWGIYGHPRKMPVPTIRRVPWVETTAEDSRTRQPSIDETNPVDIDVGERLTALGYT
jgi:hypothetical protein